MRNERVKSFHTELAGGLSGFKRLGRQSRIFLPVKLFHEHSFSGYQLMLINCKSKRNLNNLHATSAVSYISRIYSEYNFQGFCMHACMYFYSYNISLIHAYLCVATDLLLLYQIYIAKQTDTEQEKQNSLSKLY